ncbi:NADH-quinone oxidoreductase subunit NuoF, partial [Marivivens sp.]|uniref:formate dehydrogenase beta subunit n=1 Tax=Marivivens sp. TaxID=1978374 RepID=UPI0025C464F6
MKIYIPRDAAAKALGAERIVKAVEAEIKERGIDAQIIRNGSRGMIWLEPLVEVETAEGRVGYGPVTVADVKSIFKGDSDKALGDVEQIPFFAAQTRLTFARVGKIDPLSLSDYEAHGGLVGLRRAITMSAEAVVDEVKTSGLRGRGGAGFPTGIKWDTVRLAQGEKKYIVCNADEGDSGTFADRMIMEGDPFTLIEGMIIAGLATHATKGFVYIRSEYPDAIEQMEAACVIARDAGVLGNVLNSGHQFDIEIRVGAGAYVCGEETSLLNSLEGKRGTVRAKPPLPALQGFMGRPTVVNNVISLATVPVIFEKGAQHYADFGLGRSKGTMPIQIAGNVKFGGLFETAFGMPLGDLVNKIGGGTASGRPVKAVQVGGPLGAYMPVSK